MQDSETSQERTANGRSRVPGLEQLIPDWEVVGPLSVSETLTGNVQLPGVPHCRVLTHPNCLYT